METKIIEEKVKKLILEQIKGLSVEAYDNPTDDNICELFNAVEYLKKVLKIGNYTSPISTWQQSPLTPSQPSWDLNNVTARVRKSFDTGDDIF